MENLIYFSYHQFDNTMNDIEKPELYILQNDFVDITTTAVATPAVRDEIEHQVESSEDF